MTLPSRSSLNAQNKEQNKADDFEPQYNGDLTTAERAKKELDAATIMAVQEFKKILTNPESSPSERIKAASAIISTGHGKDGLKLEETKQNHAQIIADALAGSRYPLKNQLNEAATRYNEIHPESAEIINDFIEFMSKQSYVG